MIVNITSCYRDVSGSEDSEADGRVHVRPTDGTESLDQHADEEPEEETGVGCVRRVVFPVVRNQDEGYEENEGQSGQTLGNDFPPEVDRLDVRQ